MKKLIAVLFLSLVATGAMAGGFAWSSDTLSTAAQYQVSSDLPVSGELDKVIVWNNSAGCTTVVVIATYAGDTIADVIFSNAVANTTPVVARPRRVGTDTAGTLLTSAYGNSVTGAATTVISLPYERFVLGGLTKVKVLLQDAATTKTNETSVQFITK